MTDATTLNYSWRKITKFFFFYLFFLFFSPQQCKNPYECWHFNLQKLQQVVTAFSSTCSSKINVPLQQAKNGKKKKKIELFESTGWNNIASWQEMIIHLGLNVQPLRSVKSMLMNSVGVGTFCMAYEAKFSNCLRAQFHTSAYQPGWGEEHICTDLTCIPAVKHWLQQWTNDFRSTAIELGQWINQPTRITSCKDGQSVIYSRGAFVLELVRVGEEEPSTTSRKYTE